MSDENARCSLNRRHFLGCLSCVAGLQLVGKTALAAQDAGPPPAHKFKDRSDVTFEESFRLIYADGLLPHLKAIGDEIGRKRMIKIVQSAADARALEGGKKAGQEHAEAAGLEKFTEWSRKPDRFWQHALTFSVAESTPRAFEINVTECLWAKTFREAGGEDVGYAVICHPDFMVAKGYSNKLRMVRTKTLMQGHDRCDHRWLWEA